LIGSRDPDEDAARSGEFATEDGKVQSTLRTSATVGGIDVPAWAGIEASTEEKTVAITL